METSSPQPSIRRSAWPAHAFLSATLVYLSSLSALWLFGDGELEGSSYATVSLLAASVAGPLGFVMFARMAGWLPREVSARAAYAGRGVCFGLALACAAMNFLHPPWVLFYYFVPGTAPLTLASLAVLHFAYRPFEAKHSLAAWATAALLIAEICAAIYGGQALFATLRTEIDAFAVILFCGQAIVCLLLAHRSRRLSAMAAHC